MDRKTGFRVGTARNSLKVNYCFETPLCHTHQYAGAGRDGSSFFGVLATGFRCHYASEGRRIFTGAGKRTGARRMSARPTRPSGRKWTAQPLGEYLSVTIKSIEPCSPLQARFAASRSSAFFATLEFRNFPLICSLLPFSATITAIVERSAQR